LQIPGGPFRFVPLRRFGNRGILTPFFRGDPAVVSRGAPTIEPITLKHVYTRTDFKEHFMHEKDDHTVMTAIDARGARLGRPMLVVLIVSTLTVIGIFSLLYYGTYG
jgi:hypothetical protein